MQATDAGNETKKMRLLKEAGPLQALEDLVPSYIFEAVLVK